MTGNSILMTAVFLVLMIAAAISVFITYRQTNRVLKDNSRLTSMVASLKQETEEQQKTLEKLMEQLRTKDKETELLQKARSLHEKTKDMSDEELCAWIDLQVTEGHPFCDPRLNLKTMAQKLGLTQKKIKQLLRDSTRYDRLYDYLTEKRVLYACELIKENPQWSIDAVSKEADFVSRTTFQAEFKKRIGLTPALYRQHSQAEMV